MVGKSGSCYKPCVKRRPCSTGVANSIARVSPHHSSNSQSSRFTVINKGAGSSIARVSPHHSSNSQSSRFTVINKGAGSSIARVSPHHSSNSQSSRFTVINKGAGISLSDAFVFFVVPAKKSWTKKCWTPSSTISLVLSVWFL